VIDSTATHIGDGKPATVLKESAFQGAGLEVIFRSDDISSPTDWRIHDRRHAVVVHLGGTMRRLETELDGFGGSTGPALPGEVWTVPAERHYASHACGGAIEYALMFLDPAVQDGIFGTTGGRRELAAVAGAYDALLRHAVHELMVIKDSADDVSRMLAESLSRSVTLHLCRTYMDRVALPAKGPAGQRLSARVSRQLREFIHENLGDPITLNELSRLAGLTTHQLLVAFRQAFGTTPAQYIIQQRLRSAQRQLASSQKDVTQIALDSGFSSHSHMTACFRQRLGCCPTEYRARRGV
jgi:AraC family transcriptional regulator